MRIWSKCENEARKSKGKKDKDEDRKSAWLRDAEIAKQAQGWKRDKGGDGSQGAKRGGVKEQDEKMRVIVKGQGDWEIRLNHLLSGDLKNTHSAGHQTLGP